MISNNKFLKRNADILKKLQIKEINLNNKYKNKNNLNNKKMKEEK